MTVTVGVTYKVHLRRQNREINLRVKKVIIKPWKMATDHIHVDAAAISFVRRVKNHPDLYSRFRRSLVGFATGKFDAPILQLGLESLFQSHGDLLVGFHTFLPPPPPISHASPSSSFQPMKRLRENEEDDTHVTNVEETVKFLNKVKKRFSNDVYLKFLEILKAYGKREIGKTEIFCEVKELFGDNTDLLKGFDSILRNEKKAIVKDEDLPPTKRSRKPKALALSLSDECDAEDDLCEVEVMLSNLGTAIVAANRLMEFLEKSEQEKEICIDHWFTALNLGCIRRVCKGREDVIQNLRQQPRCVLPKILDDLKSKETELKESRDKKVKGLRKLKAELHNKDLNTDS